jgi:hypothetical protein
MVVSVVPVSILPWSLGHSVYAHVCCDLNTWVQLKWDNVLLGTIPAYFHLGLCVGSKMA